MGRRILFSDLDGTLVHYPKDIESFCSIENINDEAGTADIRYHDTNQVFQCVALRSMTNNSGYISKRTLDLVEKLRNEKNVCFVIITGARSSTYLMRRPFLPTSDYEFFENGGRMIHSGKVDAEYTLAGIVPEMKELRGFDDIDYYEQQVKLGSADGAGTSIPNPAASLPSPNQRKSVLWQLYQEMVQEGGWELDAKDYYTNFRVDLSKSQHGIVQLQEKLKQRDGALSSSFNLGKADVYPSSSGKANAAKHVIKAERASISDTIALFDDDNDLELGALCGKAFLPGATHPSVMEAARKYSHWEFTVSRGVRGTEEALEKICAYIEAQE